MTFVILYRFPLLLVSDMPILNKPQTKAELIFKRNLGLSFVARRYSFNSSIIFNNFRQNIIIIVIIIIIIIIIITNIIIITIIVICIIIIVIVMIIISLFESH